ncbi:MAG: hypothetical protein KBA61_02855 [Spirochaetes bacterium]|nr:hypothetical protein [Spirochaetota bacterium]
MKWTLAILLLSITTLAANPRQWSDVIIGKGFRNPNTYFIVCKGFPREGLENEIQRRGTAREAALINAQFFAREIFDDSVDVVRNGNAEKTEYFPGYAVVHYVIEQPGLSDRLRYY